MNAGSLSLFLLAQQEPEVVTSLLQFLFKNLGLPLFLVVLAFTTSRILERRHRASILQREAEMAFMVVSDLKGHPCAAQGSSGAALVVAEVVIASDYLKVFFASFRKIFGGEVRSYQNMLTRARDEARVRLMEQARKQGYSGLCNVRLETADVGGNAAERKMPMAAVIASGTAYHAAPPSAAG